jgi:hypothetical protein
MPYLSVNGTTYRTAYRTGEARRITIQQRRRALDGSLLVDDVVGGDADEPEKEENTVEFLGTSSTLFTIDTAKAFALVLTGGNVSVTGNVGTYTARAKDVKEKDVTYSAGVFRVVSAVLEEV